MSAKQALIMDLDGDMYCKECGMYVWISGVLFRNSWCSHIAQEVIGTTDEWGHPIRPDGSRVEYPPKDLGERNDIH